MNEMLLALHPPASGPYLGNSFDPTIVIFIPICTVTGVSPTFTLTLPFRYQPSEPVENSLTSAVIGMPLMTTSSGLACLNCSRVIEQVVLTAMRHSFCKIEYL